MPLIALPVAERVDGTGAVHHQEGMTVSAVADKMRARRPPLSSTRLVTVLLVKDAIFVASLLHIFAVKFRGTLLSVSLLLGMSVSVFVSPALYQSCLTKCKTYCESICSNGKIT